MEKIITAEKLQELVVLHSHLATMQSNPSFLAQYSKLYLEVLKDFTVRYSKIKAFLMSEVRELGLAGSEQMQDILIAFNTITYGNDYVLFNIISDNYLDSYTYSGKYGTSICGVVGWCNKKECNRILAANSYFKTLVKNRI